MLRKLYLLTEAVELHMSFYQDTLDSDENSFIEARQEILDEISSKYKESKKLCICQFRACVRCSIPEGYFNTINGYTQ
jgi:hypothetical protein